MMWYDISITSLFVINFTYFYMLFLPEISIYFLKYFLTDAQLAHFLHYHVTKIN